jgi:hypothetical protein
LLIPVALWHNRGSFFFPGEVKLRGVHLCFRQGAS